MIEKGERFTYLVATGNSKSVKENSGKTYRYYECLCDCGNTIWTRGTRLKYGTTKSCGCYAKKSKVHQKHGLTNHRLYSIWSGMRTRCNKEYSNAYYRYGNRGIKVCSEWDNTNDGFENFYNWSIQNGYGENFTIDRIDNDDGYSPDNCRWVTMQEQSRNKSSNRYVIYKGEKLILTDMAKKYGLIPKTLQGRLDSPNKRVEEAIEMPVEVNKREVEYQGKMVSLKEFAKLTGVNFNTLNTRYTKGYTTSEELLKHNRQLIKKVFLKIDKESGEIIGRYLGSQEALDSTNGKAKSRIIECCNGKAKSAYGYFWKYE